MPKFVLIDPSVKDFQGHYYEHGVRVLKAAETHGYSPFLAANRLFRDSGRGNVKVHPVYKYAFWVSLADAGLLRRLRIWGRTLKSLFTRLKARLLFSRTGLLWLLARNPRECLQGGILTHRSVLPVFLLLVLNYLARVAGAGVRLAWRAIPLRRYLGERWADSRGLVGTLLLPVRLVFGAGGPLLSSLGVRLKMKQFARDTRRLFRDIPLEEGDCVFISCASVVEVVALALYFRRDPRSSLADWHLMFRHQLYGPHEEQPSSETYRPVRNALEEFRRTCSGHRVHFYTDTTELAQHYKMLGVFDFQPLPVPVDDEYHALRREAPPAAPLQITYAGDARGEKGYHHLPRIVGDLWVRYVAAGRARFVVQSNLSVLEGTLETVVARAQLDLLPPDKVSLLREPLDCKGYRDLVLGADVILLPYDNPAHYFAASSGILVEALATGTPVIVPGGTWLSLQLTEAIGRYHRELRQQVPLLDTRPGGAVRWRLEGSRRAEALVDGRLALAGRRRRACLIPACKTATHLLISFQPHAERQGNFVEVHVRQYDDSRDALAERTYVVGGDDSPASILIELEPEVSRLRVGCRNAFNDGLIELSQIRFDFLRSAAPLPLSAVGLVFSRPEELTDAVREVIEHHAHYHRTAQEFSTQWVRYHNVSHLIALLVENTRRGGPSPGEVLPRAPKFLTAAGHAPSPKEQLCQEAS